MATAFQRTLDPKARYPPPVIVIVRVTDTSAGGLQVHYSRTCLRSASKSKRPEIDADPGSYLFDFDHHTDAEDAEDSDSAISGASDKLVVKMRVKSTPNAEPKRLANNAPKPVVKPEQKTFSKTESKPTDAADTKADTKTDNPSDIKLASKPVNKKLAIRASVRLGKKPASATSSASAMNAYTPLTEEQIARAKPIEMRRHVSDDIDTTGWFDPVPMKYPRPVASHVMPATINLNQEFKVPQYTSRPIPNPEAVKNTFRPGNDPMEVDSEGDVSEFDDVSSYLIFI